MLTGVDHIVIVVPDLVTAIANYTELGFTVVPGGRHPIGTHNALIAFADGSYIELIAFFEPNPTHRWAQLLEQGGGLIDYCMQTNNLEADSAAFRAAGVPMTEKMPLSRMRPDGYKLDWVLAVPATTQGYTPFLIEDITPRGERVPSVSEHANGVTGIGTLTIVVSNRFAADAFGKVAGSEGMSITRPEIAVTGVRHTSDIHTFDFITPTGAGEIADRLEQWGSLIMGARLKTNGSQRGLLDQGLALNALLTLE